MTTCRKWGEEGVVVEMTGFHSDSDASVHLWLRVKIMCTCKNTVFTFRVTSGV